MGNIYHSWNGTILTITSDSGTSSADLKGDIGIRGPQGEPGTAAIAPEAVISVNGKTGEVVLSAEDVGALPDSTVIPSVDGLASKEYVDSAIAGVEIIGGSGLTVAQVNALNNMFKICAYDESQDISGVYAAFKTAFGLTGEEEHTHSYTYTITTAASCTVAGVKTYTCDCGASYTETIPAIGHNYVDGVCTRCGASDPDYVVEVTLNSITAAYSGGEVDAGASLDSLTGITVTAHYSDGNSNAVTDYTLSGEIAEGENTITVTYGGKTATFTVTGIGVTIYEPESNTITSADVSIANTLVDINTGTTTTNASWVASDYVEIPVGNDYMVLQTSTSSSIRYALYDSNKTYIKGAVLSGVTKTTVELPDNAAYIRLASNNKTIGVVEVAVGKTMVTNWGDSSYDTILEDGSIGTNTVEYMLSDGYVKIPDGAQMIFWCNKNGYTFSKTMVGIYDNAYGFEVRSGSIATGAVAFGNTNTTNSIDLTALTNPTYLKIAVDGLSTTNNNPAEQYVVGYC